MGSALATAPRFGPKLITPGEALKVSSYQYPPLVDARAPGYGLAAAIVQAALQEGNLPVEMEILPVRSLAKRSILYDGAPALLAPTALFSRAELGRLSVLPCVTVSQSYYFYEPAHRELAGGKGGARSLQGYRVGVVKGEESQQQGAKVTSDDPRALLRRLKERELDLVLLPDLVARQLVRTYYREEGASFQPAGAGPPLPLALLVKPGDARGTRIKAAYRKGMQAIRKNGAFDRFVSQYQDDGASPETYRTVVPEGIIEFGSSETPPFYSPQLPNDGMAGEIVHALFNELHLQSLIRYFPLKRLYTDHQNNHLGDPENFAGQEFTAIVPIAVYRPAFFYYRPRHPHGMRFRAPRDLKGYRIGVLRGTVESRDFFAANGISVTEVDSEQSLLHLLKEGRIDLCGMVRETGEYTARKLFPREAADFAPLEIPGAKGPIAVMISTRQPDGKKLGERVNEALGRLVKNGTYQRIVARYYGGKIPADWFQDLERFKARYREKVNGAP